VIGDARLGEALEHRRVLTAAGLFEENRRRQLVDWTWTMVHDQLLRRLETNPLRIFDSKDEGDRKLCEDAPKPLEFLREAALALKKGGRIYIEVPDESLLTLRASARKALGLYRGNPLHHGHINFFTPGSLLFLLEEAGLRAEILKQASIAADEDRLLLTLKKKLPAWVKALSLGARLTKADTLLGLGNTVCLCARK